MLDKDLVVIGGGPGGYVAAIHAAHLGARVALIEKDRLGGVCLSHGCIPTKALIRSIEVLSEVKRAPEFGIDTSGVTVNFARIMARKTKIVAQLVDGVERLLKANNITLFKGTGRVISPGLVKVNNDEVATRYVVIATGSQPRTLPIPGLTLPGVLSTDDILELREIPKSLVIIGGSLVGLEFAGIFNALGTRVTILEQRPFLQIGMIDEDIVRRFTQMLPGRGVNVKVNAMVKGIQSAGEGLKALWDTPGGEDSAGGQIILLAAGRLPYTEGLGLAELGLRLDGSCIRADEHLETNLKHIYAVGDVLGKYMMAHVASHQGKIAVENALGKSGKVDYKAVPTCVFTLPEMAGVGMTEQEARTRGIPYKASKFPFLASGRAATMGESHGTVKMIAEAETGKILGVHILGVHASDLIAEAALAIQMGATAQDLAHTIHAHPSLPEALLEAAMGQLEGAIHYHKLPGAN